MEDLNPRPGPRVDKRGIRPAPAFAIEQLPGPADARVLRMIGEFDLAASDSFREHLATALAVVPNVMLDMEETEFIDSSMLKELLRGSEAAAGAGGRLVLTGMRPSVQRLFELTSISQLLEIVPSR